MKKEQICTKTVMDTSDPNIKFDANGVCNYWHEYNDFIKKREESGKFNEANLLKIIERVKEENINKKYDCLIGVSGGIDSTYIAQKVLEYGLRTLAVHFDGGWDNEFGSHNLALMKSKLNLDVHVLKVDFEEIKDLIKAYLKSSVIDIGIYADHAIHATMYNLAKKYKINTVFIGTNYKTEFITPKAWVYNKMDLDNLRDIHAKFGELPKLKTYPTFGFEKQLYFLFKHKLEVIRMIDYLDFDTNKVTKKLKKELDWKPYPRKHGESLFTVFYQNYILPEKFGVDKRKMHLSSQICSGEITREEALVELAKPLYSPKQLKQDKTEVLRRLDINVAEFDKIMNEAAISHLYYKNDKNKRKFYMNFMRKTEKFRKLFK